MIQRKTEPGLNRIFRNYCGFALLYFFAFFAYTVVIIREIFSPLLILFYINLGIYYSRLSKYKDAEEYLQQAITMDPANKDAHYNLAVVYIEKQDRMSAIREYEVLKTLAPLAANKLCKPLNI